MPASAIVARSVPYIALYRLDGPPDLRSRQRQLLAQRVAEAIFAADHAPTRADLVVGVTEPRELNLYREGDDYSPPFDLAIKAEYPDSRAFHRNLASAEISALFATWSAYRTEETVRKGSWPAIARGAGEVAGVHMLHPLRFHADLPMSALLRSWRDIHGDLATEAHAGATYYAQNLVLEQLRDGQIEYGGFSEFHFPTRGALIEGYFASDAARRSVRHDIRHFIDGIPPRLFGTAHHYER